MTELAIKRMIFTDKSTIGDLFIEGEFECNTLEDTCRNRAGTDSILQKNEKVYAETAIPAGRYEIKMRFSNSFQRNMPYLQSVPYFSDIMIHWGNWSKDTKGCILVGDKTGDADFISNSQKRYNDFEPKLLRLLAIGPVFVTIMGGYTA